MTPRWRHTLSRALWSTGLAAVLALVMSLYVQPDFMVTMAQQIWACF
jgi:hypothetical protein